MNHVKLIGGSINTARHDMEKIKTAKEEIRKSTQDEKDRFANRRNRTSGEDIDWTNWKSEHAG